MIYNSWGHHSNAGEKKNSVTNKNNKTKTEINDETEDDTYNLPEVQ